MRDWIKEAADRARAELEEMKRLDPALARKLEAAGRRRWSMECDDQKADDPRRGQAADINRLNRGNV